jgi:hypothetical protein
MSLHRERGPMVVDDLSALPPTPIVVAEGSTLPAAAVTDRSRAVWLMPTPEFQRARLAAQGRIGGRARLDELLRDVIEAEAREHGVPMLRVDDATTVAAAVEEHFASALAAGPRARTRAERRALLREANDAIVGQVRGYYARPWADGDPEAVVRSFACECGDPECTADLQLTIGAVAAGPALAPGHA